MDLVQFSSVQGKVVTIPLHTWNLHKTQKATLGKE